jgi:capsular polysaccharide biosynthesis protein
VTPQRLRWPTNPRNLAVLVAISLVAGIIVGLIAAVATKHGTKTFQSQAVREIDQPTAVALSTDDGVIAKLSRLRFKYAGLINTETFAAPVAAKLGLPTGAVLGTLYPIVDPSTLIMAVGARSHDRTQAQQLANAGAQELVDYTQTEQNALKVPATAKISFRIVTPAGQAIRTAPTDQRVSLIGLGAFAFVAAGTFAFGYIWRRDPDTA